MAVEVPGAIFDAWMIALEPLAEQDTEPGQHRYPDGGIVMTPKNVLGYLERHSSGSHMIETDEYESPGWRKRRVVAMGDVVTLGADDEDDTRTKAVIQNAERLTGIRADETDYAN